MSTLEEIKEQYAKERGFDNWKANREYLNTFHVSVTEGALDEIYKRFASQQVKEALEARPEYIKDYEKSLKEKEDELKELIAEYKDKNRKAIKEALEEAAEKAKMKYWNGYLKRETKHNHIQIGEDNVQIDKQSILELKKNYQ